MLINIFLNAFFLKPFHYPYLNEHFKLVVKLFGFCRQVLKKIKENSYQSSCDTCVCERTQTEFNTQLLINISTCSNETHTYIHTHARKTNEMITYLSVQHLLLLFLLISRKYATLIPLHLIVYCCQERICLFAWLLLCDKSAPII